MDPALQSMIANMPEKTGKSLEEWKKLLQAKSFSKHSEAVNFLKKEHGVTHGFANTIVHLSKDQSASPDDLTKTQYTGKEHLFPVFEKVRAAVEKLGADVTITPKKTSVSFIRKKQFALITPATKTRLDLGLKLPGKPLTTRLENSGPFGTMCTHRVRLEKPEDVDKELLSWLKEAYEKAV
jgi:predicted transport protein